MEAPSRERPPRARVVFTESLTYDVRNGRVSEAGALKKRRQELASTEKLYLRDIHI